MVSPKELDSLKAFLNRLSTETLITLLRETPLPERALSFRLLEKEKALEVFEMLERSEQSELIRAMEDPQLIELLSQLDTEQQAELMEELPAKVVKRILDELPPETREQIGLVLGFPEGSAGRLMDPTYLALPELTLVKAALEAVHNSPLEPEDLEVVFVLGEGRLYKGYITLPRLVKAPSTDVLIDHIEESEVAVSAYAPEETAMKMFLEKRLKILPVVDKEGRFVGVIHAKRMVREVQERESRRVVQFGGTPGLPPKGEDIDMLRDPLHRIFLGRFFWLSLLTIFGAFTSTFVAAQQEILGAVLILAAFIAPIIDMGGNTGSQTATLVIRAMALGQIRPTLRDFFKVVVRDLPVALTLGIAVGILEAILAFLTKDITGEVLWVVSLSMITVTALGSLIGILLPFLAKKLGADPAILSAPVITSVMDLLGVVVYFGFAYIFLRHLLS